MEKLLVIQCVELITVLWTSRNQSGHMVVTLNQLQVGKTHELLHYPVLFAQNMLAYSSFFTHKLCSVSSLLPDFCCATSRYRAKIILTRA
jgi:hypothetical protein